MSKEDPIENQTESDALSSPELEAKAQEIKQVVEARIRDGILSEHIADCLDDIGMLRTFQYEVGQVVKLMEERNLLEVKIWGRKKGDGNEAN